jgi:hypothetical protein
MGTKIKEGCGLPDGREFMKCMDCDFKNDEKQCEQLRDFRGFVITYQALDLKTIRGQLEWWLNEEDRARAIGTLEEINEARRQIRELIGRIPCGEESGNTGT